MDTLCEVVPRPAFATPLTPGRPNLLAEAKGVAAMLGFTLAPWQEYFLALATEYEEGNPVDGIVPYWRYVTLTVPRQCGKSECVCTMSVSVAVDGILPAERGRPEDGLYGAFDGGGD